MSIIKKGHPRFGAQKGDVVGGWECVERGCRCLRYPNIKRTKPVRVCPSCRVVTRWRRVLFEAQWVDNVLRAVRGGNVLMEVHEIFLKLPEGGRLRWPVTATTDDRRRRFAERIALAYGFEVER